MEIIKKKEDVEKFMSWVCTGMPSAAVVEEDWAIWDFRYNDPAISVINGGVTTISCDTSDQWSCFSSGQGWSDQEKTPYSVEEMKKYIWKNRKHINKGILEYAEFCG